MTPAIGSSVRIKGKGIHDGRTGTVTDTESFWVGLRFVQVELDPKPPLPSWAIVPVEELEVIAASERGVTQGDLFGGAQ